MNVIRLDTVADNPYADLWMLRLEERLLVAREEMTGPKTVTFCYWDQPGRGNPRR